MIDELIEFISEKIPQEEYNIENEIFENDNKVIFKKEPVIFKKSSTSKKEINITTFRLNRSYNNYISNFKDFYLVKTHLKDSFLESILNIIDNTDKDYNNRFRNLDIKFKYKKIMNFRKILAEKVDEFRKSYPKIKKMLGKKNVLTKEILNFDKSLNENEIFKQYISNLYDMNIYVFNMNSGKITDVNIYKSYKTVLTKHKPSIFIQKRNTLYSPIFNDKTEIFTHSEFFDLLENLSKLTDWKPKTEPKLIKFKVLELRKIAEELGISIKKESLKTKKLINKTKIELINDIEKTDDYEVIISSKIESETT